MQVQIVLATYNGAKYIEKQLHSIINQTFADWKLLIHDDGSSDNTIEIIKKYERIDNRIKILTDGLTFHNSTANFIHLLKNVDDSARYICLCDQDDIWEENKLELLSTEMSKIDNSDKIPICISTDLSLIDTDDCKFVSSYWDSIKLNKNSTFNTLLIENTATGCTMIFNKKVIEYIKSLNHSDINDIIQHDWFISLICASDGVYKQLPIQTVGYRQHENNVVGANNNKLIEKLSPKGFLKTYKNIKQLKNKVIKQLNVINHKIKNRDCITLIDNYLNTRFIMHKVFLLKNNVCRNTPVLKKLIKFFFY